MASIVFLGSDAPAEKLVGTSCSASHPFICKVECSDCPTCVFCYPSQIPDGSIANDKEARAYEDGEAVT